MLNKIQIQINFGFYKITDQNSFCSTKTFDQKEFFGPKNVRSKIGFCFKDVFGPKNKREPPQFFGQNIL